MLKTLFKPLASLKLTVALLALSMLLIYAATGAQTEMPVEDVQARFLHSFFCWLPVRFLIPLAPGRERFAASIPMLGGFTIGLAMLVNLIAAHVLRFKFNIKRVGIILIHFSVILLLAGEGVSSALMTSDQMSLTEGKGVNWAFNLSHVELAVIDPSQPGYDSVTAIPEALIDKPHATVSDERLPFTLRIDDYFPNSVPLGPMQPTDAPRATAGRFVGLSARSIPRITGTEGGEINAPTLFATIISKSGQELGRYVFPLNRADPANPEPQDIAIGSKTYRLQFRLKRTYQDYTVYLKKFSFERYAGSETASNFTSFVHLIDSQHGVDRPDIRIWMNHPLRYHGQTFYQVAFDPNNNKVSTLQVVHNPVNDLPYIALAIGGVGLLYHFLFQLITFMLRPAPQPRAASGRPLPLTASPQPLLFGLASWIVLGLAVLALVAWFVRPMPKGDRPGFDLEAFGKLPIQYDGRVQPYDSVARNALKVLSGHETFRPDPDKPALPATQWLLDTMVRSDIAQNYKVIRVDHPQVVSLIHGDPKDKFFSFALLDPQLPTLNAVYNNVQNTPASSRDTFDRKINELGEKIKIIMPLIRFSRAGSMMVIPPTPDVPRWRALSEINFNEKTQPLAVQQYTQLLGDYINNDPVAFNSDVAAFRTNVTTTIPHDALWASFEADYNRADLFTICMIFYLVAFLVACISWMVWRRPLAQAAFMFVVVAVSLHVVALVARICISGRPPVINLYSSAVFIGCGGALLGMAAEYFLARMTGRGATSLGTCAAAVVGFCSLLIADRLGIMLDVGGDTMPVMRAVLNTNFWLATHVTCVSIGYLSAFVACILGIIYIFAGLFTPALAGGVSKGFSRVIYGVICFAMLFSFVGTILGGLWANDSWGRFWGWDPKENGAALVVLFSALVIHARWAGLVRERGVAVMAVGGGVITAWSWFGTNMLGVGLHSYGFMEAALTPFSLAVFLLAGIVTVGWIMPTSLWRSFAPPPIPQANREPEPVR